MWKSELCVVHMHGLWCYCDVVFATS